MTQAEKEFTARGLHVETVDSKDNFIRNIRTIGTANNTGEDTITVVNIQKFSTESIARKADYDINVQRVYFLDEAHRSYNPKGSFLANLMASDREAVMIALTGTPLIGEGYNTKDVFGEYIHKYYYNRSIVDGYTLKLIREGIKTECQEDGKEDYHSQPDHARSYRGSRRMSSSCSYIFLSRRHEEMWNQITSKANIQF